MTYSKSEVAHMKSVTEIEMASDGSFQRHEHVLPPVRDLIYIEGELLDLVLGAAARTARERDSYVIVGLTDSGPVLDALAKLRLIYPNVLHVARAGGYVPASLPSLEKRKERESLSDLDLFAEFFNETTSETLSAEERTTLVEALSAVQNAGRERLT